MFSRSSVQKLMGFVLGSVAVIPITLLPVQGQGSASRLPVVRGCVCDAHQHGLAAVTVIAREENRKTSVSTRTDSDGNYQFALSPGSYSIRAERAGSPVSSFGPFELGTGDKRQVDLIIVEAQPLSSTGTPDFFDEPQFTVAGVADSTNLGGHASSTMAPRTESLANEIESLTSGASTPASRTELEQARSAAQALLRKSDTAELHHRLGGLEEKLDNPLQAVREYQRAAQMETSEINLFDWGAELLMHGATEPASQVFSEGHLRFPNSARMLIGLGVAKYSRGSYQEAARYFCEASDLNLRDATPYFFLSKIAGTEFAESAEITKRLGRFAQLQPGNARAQYYYAAALWRQRQPGDAAAFAKVEPLLVRSVRLDPNFADAYLQLGTVYADQKDLKQAIPAYQKAIAIDGKLSEAHYRLAQAYAATGDMTRSREQIELYKQISRETAAERERRELHHFVINMQSQSPAEPRQ